jgi:hypothetical protein
MSNPTGMERSLKPRVPEISIKLGSPSAPLARLAADLRNRALTPRNNHLSDLWIAWQASTRLTLDQAAARPERV